MSPARDFWSRRRAQVEAEAQEQARAADVEARSARELEISEKTDAELCADLGLPDPDALQQGDDFSAFMSRAVPDRLRRRALRRLWVSNPVLANVDGLVDYGGDFTDSATVIENLQTAYQVGRGMTAHVEEMARQAAAEADAQSADEDAPVDAPVAEEADTEEADTALAAAEDPAPEIAQPHVWTADAPSEPDPAPRRRMRFAFDDTGVSA